MIPQRSAFPAICCLQAAKIFGAMLAARLIPTPTGRIASKAPRRPGIKNSNERSITNEEPVPNCFVISSTKSIRSNFAEASLAATALVSRARHQSGRASEMLWRPRPYIPSESWPRRLPRLGHHFMAGAENSKKKEVPLVG